MTNTRIRHLVLALLVGIVAVTIAATAPGSAGDRTKPPKAAVDAPRSVLVEPSTANPDDSAGVVDPAKDQGLAVVLRDPDTGKVLRDPATGLPQLARDPSGSVKLFKAAEVPADQIQAQDKLNETIKKAQDGDPGARKELQDEADATAKAIKLHPNGK